MNEPITPRPPTFQELAKKESMRLIPNAAMVLRSPMTDISRIQLIEYLLENLEFKGTIHQIRELVNDPKWDDKV